MIKTRPISITKSLIEGVEGHKELLSYIARVSNPSNQMNFETAQGLLNYCRRNAHWSVFEMMDVTIEIEAPRDVTRQVLRHATARFQEFSQRYAIVTDDMFTTKRELRGQDVKNRQNSIDNFSPEDKAEFEADQAKVLTEARSVYSKWLERGAAKECVRAVLPEGLTLSRMYMKANLRTWLHYTDLRGGNGTQLEHIEIAKQCAAILQELLPDVFLKDK